MVLIKVVENLLEGFVRNLDVLVPLFHWVLFEHATIEIGDPPEESFQRRCTVFGTKALVEEPQQKISIKRVKFVLPVFVPTAFKTVTEVFVVTIEKAFSLNEIDEHEAV